jgi:hypothetical protein
MIFNQPIVMDEPLPAGLILLIDGANGIYIPKYFAKSFAADCAAMTQEMCRDLSAPDNDSYWETWETVLDSVTINLYGQNYALYQDQDLWGVPLFEAETGN